MKISRNFSENFEKYFKKYRKLFRKLSIGTQNFEKYFGKNQRISRNNSDVFEKHFPEILFSELFLKNSKKNHCKAFVA